MIGSAPGKVVLWGEYAVLAGAPAATMAVNRRAEVTIEPHEQRWQFRCRGYLTPGVQTSRAAFTRAPAAAVAEHILEHWAYERLPQPFTVTSDSTAFYDATGNKHGIGSSAAVCTATYAALAELMGRPTSLEEVTRIHRAMQGGKGSGLDVAACWHGGITRFQQGAARAMQLPGDVDWCVVWTGASSSTGAALNSFSQWQSEADTAPLDALCTASRELCDQRFTLDGLAKYVACLRGFDAAAQLNIFTPQHERLATIASAHGLVYKPCGAGGGDIGIACGVDTDALRGFRTTAANEQFVPLDLEVASHGVAVSG